MEYKNKIVCFIDILGFREMVEENISDPLNIYSILSKISTEITDWHGAPISSNLDLVITQFSDSIVFSFVPSMHYFMQFSFFKGLSIKMVMDGVVLRGGITYGKIFHNSDFVFGPAMNKAYELEHKVAVFPRIVIDQSALDLKNEDGKTVTDFSGQVLFKTKALGYSFIDYINNVFAYTDEIEYYRKLRVIIIKGLETKCSRVKEKYEWMKKEYNEAKTNFPKLEEL